MLRSRGLRLSLFGALVFLLSVTALIFLPNGGPVVGMLAGGMCVWTGFIWTLLGYYGATPKPPRDG